MSKSTWAVEHELAVTHDYSPILRAAGINPEHMTSIDIWELAGYIENDAEVDRLYWEEPPTDLAARNAMDLDGQRNLLIRAIEGMDPGARRAMAERAAAKMI